MPWDNVPKEKWGEMEKCVMGVMKDGKGKEAATAICYGSVVEGKSIADATAEYNNAAIKLIEASFETKQRDISQAWNSQFTVEAQPVNVGGFWLVETFPEYVIASSNGKYYKVPYSETDGEITFDDRSAWVEVEEKKEWVDIVKAITKRISSNALKTISKDDDELRVANYIVLFGGRDLEWLRSGKNPDGSKGEYFTPKTQFESSYTKSGFLYVDWEHGQGKSVDGNDAPGSDDVLGYVDWKTARKDDRGIFVERVLSRRNEYVKMLEELIDAGLIGTSTQAVKGTIKKKKNGEIEVWQLEKDSLTVSPAEPRMMTENTVAALKALAETFPNLQVFQKDGATIDESTTGTGDGFNYAQLRAKAFLILEGSLEP